MKTLILLALTTLVGLATITSAFPPAPVFREPPKKPDVSALMQGTWEIQQNGGNVARHPLASSIPPPLPIRIQGTSWAYINRLDREILKYKLVLDPKASPATIEFEVHPNDPGHMKGGLVCMKGIIKVEGDTLTFCYVPRNAERPKQFIAGSRVMPNGTLVTTVTMKRVK